MSSRFSLLIIAHYQASLLFWR